MPKLDGSMVHGLTQRMQQLPSVDRLLQQPLALHLIGMHGHTLVSQQARELLHTARQAYRASQFQAAQGADASNKFTPMVDAQNLDAWATALQTRCTQALKPRMQRVINMTGTVIHTNLGRAVLSAQAMAHVQNMMAAPNNLEYDLDRGERGDRDSIVEALICQITGAEAATVVNNNAAAVLLCLAALSAGREAVVSRGEQVEIGGAFRMPDVMSAAGARMVEVGTTNRTHLRDYEKAITSHTALLQKVHTSNYAVQGFTQSVSEAELAPLARQYDLALVSDLGSGSLVDLTRWGLPAEPTPQAMLAAGCDVVTFSGDKLLGGPQAGLIVGRKDFIQSIKKHPLKRALRLSKLPLAALEATLQLYLQPERLVQELPTLRWLTRAQTDIERCAAQMLAALQAALDRCPRVDTLVQAEGAIYSASVQALMSQIGSGSLPVDRLPSAGLCVGVNRKKGVGTALDQLARALRSLPTPIIGRIEKNALWLDARCIDDPATVCDALAHLWLDQPSPADAFVQRSTA